MNEIIRCDNLHKTFKENMSEIIILNRISLQIATGEKIAIIGPSGSGKSTLLHLLGGLDTPTSGQVSVMGAAWHTLSEKKRCQVRNQHLGFIYQFHHLLPEFTAFENVALPLLIAKRPLQEIDTRVARLLDNVGLSHRMTHKPAQLSGGERQRVAIARALILNPSCILADEPTGNLDTDTAAHIFQLMLDLNRQTKTALVVVTHDLTLAKQMDRCLKLTNGQLTPV